MDKFKIISIMNEAMLKMLKDKEENCEINLQIQKYLEDESIFFKLTEKQANKILKNVGVRDEKLKDIYKELISPKAYFELVNKGKIKENDKKILIKYDSYNSENLFKR